MNYWNFSPGELESLVFRRSTGATGFEGIPGSFSFEVPNNHSAQNQTNTPPSNSSNDHCAMQQQARQQQQHPQTTTRNMTATPPNASYHHHQQQPQQQQQQQQSQQQVQLVQVKMEPMDRSQQAAPGGSLSLQLAHVQPLNNDVFLFPTGNPQGTASNPVVASVAGMLLSALPPVVSLANASVAPTTSVTSAAATAAASAAAAAKPKKKKKKVSLGTAPPSMAMPRAPAPRAQCLLCERNYGNRRDLRRHVLAHHEGVRYMCRLCQKVMMSAKSVRAHLKSSAHRLLNDDEIALNIEKMTPSAVASATMVPLASFNSGAGSSSGSTSATSKKET